MRYITFNFMFYFYVVGRLKLYFIMIHITILKMIIKSNSIENTNEIVKIDSGDAVK